MAKLWLPFYDVGDALKVGVPLEKTLNLQLFSFLSSKIRQASGGTALPGIFLNSTPDSPTQTINPQWITYVASASAQNGIPTAPIPNAQGFVIEPARLRPKCVMRSLNALYLRLYRTEFLNPNFVSAARSTGQLVAGSLTFHMAAKTSWRSPWTGTQATVKGPEKELPFYDVTAPFGPGKVNNPVDQALVSILLQKIYAGLPNLFSGLALNPNQVIGPAGVAIFGDQARAMGWPGDSTCFEPCNGNPAAPSMMRALNYYVQLAMPSPSNLDITSWSSVQNWSQLKGQLLMNQSSLYF